MSFISQGMHTILHIMCNILHILVVCNLFTVPFTTVLFCGYLLFQVDYINCVAQAKFTLGDNKVLHISHPNLKKCEILTLNIL